MSPFLSPIGPTIFHDDAAVKFFDALAKAQAMIEPPTKDQTAEVVSKRTGGKYSYSYAGLPSIIDAVRGPMTSNGIAFIQHASYQSTTPTTGDENKKVTGYGFAIVTTELAGHGFSIQSTLHMPCGETPQEIGSAITYGRRYGLQSMCGLCPEDDDDAGKAQAGIEKRRQDADVKAKAESADRLTRARQSFGAAVKEAEALGIAKVPKTADESRTLIGELIGVQYDAGTDVAFDEFRAAETELRNRIKITKDERGIA